MVIVIAIAALLMQGGCEMHRLEMLTNANKELSSVDFNLLEGVKFSGPREVTPAELQARLIYGM